MVGRHTASGSAGVLIGADRKQEWLLPWWWAHYRRHNRHPVALVDFGMSRRSVAWARRRMLYLAPPTSTPRIQGREALPRPLADLWEQHYLGPLWESRPCWFMKPLALQLSPFQTTLWLDLDCEVLGPLDSLLARAPSILEVGLVPEPAASQEPLRAKGLLLPGEVLYNAGVLLFVPGSPLVTRWAAACCEEGWLLSGDQELLSRLIHLERHRIEELPPIYNWRFVQGLHLGAVIVHWVGEAGKRVIAQRGGMGALLE